MEVIKRDKLRCRICGRAPKDYEDLELHVHHILPWGDGGSTEAENLITLCHTCHSGLHPHYDEVLFTLIDVNMLDKARAERTEFTEGVLRYRKIIRDRLNKTRKK
ncbi:HNH endonuclease [Oscillochloris sp. ZM17-4]|nr:HNH endonuclease [Oscillochloris sp. ZM17-4]